MCSHRATFAGAAGRGIVAQRVTEYMHGLAADNECSYLCDFERIGLGVRDTDHRLYHLWPLVRRVPFLQEE